MNWFISWAVNLVKGAVLKPLTTGISVIFMWVFNALVKASPGRAAWIAKSVIGVYFDMTTPWAQFVSSYVEQLTGRKINVEDIVGKSVAGVTDQATRNFVDALFKDMLSLVMPSPEETERNPLAGGEKFLAANLKFQMDAWWLHMLGDMMSFGIFKSLKDLPNAISWSMGLGWLSWLVMGTPFKISIVDPMQKFFNRIYLTQGLTVSQLIEARRKDYIDWEYFSNKMLEMGYSPEVLTLLYNLAKKELSKAELKDMLQRGMIDEQRVVDELSSTGYSNDASIAIMHLLSDDRYYSLMDDVAKAATSSYVKGTLSKGDLDQYLKTAGYNDRERELVMIQSEIKRVEGQRVPDSDIPTLFELKVVSWPKAVEMLEQRGYDKENAEWYMKCRVKKTEWYG